MNRKQFLKAGLGCGALTVLGAQAAEPTACEKKSQYCDLWVRRLMKNIDGTLKEADRKKLLEANGRACFRSSNGEPKAPPAPDALDKFIAERQKSDGADAIRREGNAIYIALKNPGKCYCPLIGDNLKDMPATYCQCSVGYTKENFERLTGKPVKVELLESVLAGGRECRFKVIV